jgi:hypothetical protein
MIAVAVLTIVIDASLSVKNNGWNTDPELKMFNEKTWANAIGFAAYSFEGVGVILPIYDIT